MAIGRMAAAVFAPLLPASLTLADDLDTEIRKAFGNCDVCGQPATWVSCDVRQRWVLPERWLNPHCQDDRKAVWEIVPASKRRGCAKHHTPSKIYRPDGSVETR